MSLDTFNRYTGAGRPIDDMGETTPVVEVSESVRPWAKLLPAPYVPVGRFDVHKRANIVLSVGTPVALDKRGNLIPAGIPSGHTFEYDSDDFRDGLAATRNAATGAVITSATTEAKMHLGLLTSGKFARPVGVTSYNVFSHEGGVSFTGWPTYTLNHDNPVQYAVHNTMAQDLVAITCDYCLLVPYLPGKNLLGPEAKAFDNTDNEVAVLSKKAKSYVFAHDEVIPVASAISGILLSGLNIVFISPSAGLGDNGSGGTFGIFGSAAAAQFIAPGDTAGAAVDIRPVGLSVIYSNDTAKYIVVKNESFDAGTGTIANGTGVVVSGAFTATLADPLCPGDSVVARVGKFVKFDKSRHELDEIVGQVLAVDENVTDKSYLSRVKSAYERATSPGDMMPGSATRGVPFSLHMVTDGAWRQYTKLQTLSGSAISSTGLVAPALRLVTINLLR